MLKGCMRVLVGVGGGEVRVLGANGGWVAGLPNGCGGLFISGVGGW